MVECRIWWSGGHGGVEDMVEWRMWIRRLGFLTFLYLIYSPGTRGEGLEEWFSLLI
jgi:hypothetical protein